MGTNKIEFTHAHDNKCELLADGVTTRNTFYLTGETIRHDGHRWLRLICSMEQGGRCGAEARVLASDIEAAVESAYQRHTSPPPAQPSCSAKHSGTHCSHWYAEDICCACGDTQRTSAGFQMKKTERPASVKVSEPCET